MLLDSRYFVEKKIGEGGDGQVFKVLDRVTGEIRALKLLNPDRIAPDDLTFFEREFLNVKKLTHPNIVKVYDFGFQKGNYPYFTMDFVDGPAFTDFFSRPFDPTAFVKLTAEICLALDYLHSHNLIHRDIKPANILLSQENASQLPVPVLTDFGLAEDFALSEFDPRGGSHFYVSPEAIRGWKIDPRADLYSLGVTLYEALTGQKPFTADNPIDVLKQHLHRVPENPSALREDLPPEVDQLLLKLLEKDPSARYNSALEVLHDVIRLAPADVPVPKLHASTRIWGGAFVGRKKELKYLRDIFDTTRSLQRFSFAVISGEKGVGKTRLVREYSTQLQLEGVKVFFVESASTRHVPYGLILEIIRQIGISAPGGVELTGDEQTVWRTIFQHGGTQQSPDIFKDQAQVFDILGRLLQKFVRAIQNADPKQKTPLPLLVILDDFQEAPSVIHQFFRYLFFNVWNTNLLFLATASGDLSNLEQIYETVRSEKYFYWNVLQSFDYGGFRQFLSKKFADFQNFDDLANDLYQYTAGNPLYTEHLLQYFVDRNLIAWEDNHWTWKGLRGGVDLPGAISDLFRDRWKEFSHAARDVLKALVFQGDVVPLAFLKAYFEGSHTDWQAGLEELLREGLVSKILRNGAVVLQISQQSWGDFVLSTTHSVEKRKIHEHWLYVIEDLHLEIPKDYLAPLAYHALESHHWEKALHYLPQAAEYAQALFDLDHAIEFYEKFLSLSKNTPLSDRLPFLEKLAAAYEYSGQLAKALEVSDSVLQEISESDAEKSVAWNWRYRKVELLQKSGEIQAALDLLEGQRSEWESLSPEQSARGFYELGWLYRLSGKFEEAFAQYARAVDLFSQIEAQNDVALTYNRMGVTHLVQGNLEEAEEALQRALSIFEESSHLRGLAHVHNNLGILYRQKGELNLAQKHYENCLKIRRATKDITYLPQVLNNLANLQFYHSEWEKALNSYKEVLRIAQGLGLAETTAGVLENIGRLQFHLGQVEAAHEAAKKAVLLNRRLENYEGLATVFELLGDIHDLHENYRLSQGFYFRGLRILEKTQNQPAQIPLQYKLGRHFLRLGEKQKALDFFIRAEDLSQIHRLREERAEVALQILRWALRYHDHQRAEYYRNFLENNLPALKNPLQLGLAYRQLGHARQKNDEPARALENFEKALEIFEKISASVEIARTESALGSFFLAAEEHEQAHLHLKKAVQLFQKLPARNERLRITQQFLTVQEQLISKLGQNQGVSGQLTVLQQTSLIVHSIFDLETMLHNIMNTVINLLKADKAAIIFLNKQSGGLEVKVSRGMEEATIEDAIRISQSIIQRVEKTGSSVLSRNTLGDERFQHSKSVRNFQIFSLMCVPLKVDDRLIGTVYVDSRNPERIFGYRDLEFLENIADLAAVAISNSEYYEELKRKQKTSELEAHLPQPEENRLTFNEMVGTSQPMREIFNIVKRVLNKNVDILIRGESGTGKEKLAALIHFNSNRKERPFVTVNCAAIPPTLLESELFGIEKRVATGVDRHIGKFEQANGGTIFLDEIGDMSLETQAKILRVIQEREFQRIGGSKIIRIDVRIIAATNKNLEEAIRERTFRQDLYYRLNVLPIVVPPLRDRKEDIPLLVEYFIRKYNSGQLVKITDSAMRLLYRYDWPGNVRELENAVQRMLIFTEGDRITVSALPPEIQQFMPHGVPADALGRLSLRDFERELLLKSLERNHWNISRTAQALGVHRNTLHRKMKLFQISKPGV